MHNGRGDDSRHAKKLKAAAEKHGAKHLSLNQVVAGPDSSLWIIRLMCADWEIFGKVMQAASSDSAARDALAGLDAVSKVVSRRVSASVDL
jgi:hypothetical protein